MKYRTLCMTEAELAAILEVVGISQADFARLVSVTPRAVSLWMAGERAIPGPAAAYARLLQFLPPSLRQVELSRLKERKVAMREGMYGIQYRSVAGAGAGVLVLESGRVYGADPWGGKYDGEYVYDEATGMADLRLKLTFAPNAPAVFGVSHPYEWSIDVTTQLDPRKDDGQLRIATPIGPSIDVGYRYLRPMPEV